MRGVKGGLTHKQFQINLAAHRMNTVQASNLTMRRRILICLPSSSLTPMHKHRAAQVVLGDLNPNIAHTSLLKKKTSKTLPGASKVPRSSPGVPLNAPALGLVRTKKIQPYPARIYNPVLFLYPPLTSFCSVKKHAPQQITLNVSRPIKLVDRWAQAVIYQSQKRGYVFRPRQNGSLFREK